MRALVFLVVMISAGVGARAQDLLGSDRKAYGKDVRIFSTTQSGDRYETVTGRVLMDGTLAAPAKLFSDVEGLPGWIENLAKVQEIGTRDLTDRTIYMRYSAPAGFDDRDGLMRFVASKEADRVIILAFEDIPAFPMQADAVRMTDVRGRFRVEQVSPGTLAVEFRLHYDSSAKPVTLANLSVRHQVKQTLVRMRQRIEGALRGASFDDDLARALGIE
ncbi:hypothetical protein [Noviherbaspirillum sp. ST9]|uniref:hypothetical protein n=1 Tax=Noviherbaspirillum sp. ST9 TaxID=3401606 RepID=UPI003B589373